MTKHRLGLLAVVLQRWHSPLLPLSAAQSLRGGTAESNIADESRRRKRGRFKGLATGSISADLAIDAEHEHTEKNSFDHPHGPISQAKSIASNDSMANSAVDQWHRDERYTWSNDPPEEDEEGEEEEGEEEEGEEDGYDPPEEGDEGEEEEDYKGEEDNKHEGGEDAAATRLFPFEHRIIGGRASTGSSHSFTVSLQDRFGNHFCGGSLVSKDVVLTAAHCTSRVTGMGRITAVVGRRTLSDSTEGEKLKVKMEKIHPKYDMSKANEEWKYDFALLVLERPTMTKARVIALNDDPGLPRGGSLVSVMGWGDTHPSDNVRKPADALQVANLRIVDNDQCRRVTGTYGEYSVSYHGFVHDDMMCARRRRRDSCQGDSGGPLTFRGRQVGITSWGVGCGSRRFPGVYARVSAAHPWIRRVVCQRSVYPDERFDCDPW